MYGFFFGSGAPLSFNKLLNDYNQKGSRNFWEGQSFSYKYKQTPSGFSFTPLYYLICVGVCMTHSSGTWRAVYRWKSGFMATKISLLNRKNWQGG